jgi:hypothetical protein
VENLTALIEWLRAQLDEDERVARAAAGAPWSADAPGMIQVDAAAIAANKHAFGKLGYVASVQQVADCEHIAAWDPARVLSEVKSKRAILRLCAKVIEDDEGRGFYSDGWSGLSVAQPTLRQLAQPYADRPGWQDEWNVTD